MSTNIDQKKDIVGTVNEIRLDLDKTNHANSSANTVGTQIELVVSEELPILAMRQQIHEALEEYDVVVISAETGAGKTTELPQIILDDYQANLVIVTQPRRVAATSLAKFVARERGGKVGGEVGYHIGGPGGKKADKDYRGQTKILYCTDGLQVVKELYGNGIEKGQDVVLVIDEVHEWNKNIEVLVAWIKLLKKEGVRVKVVLSSATIKTEKLLNYFSEEQGNQDTIAIEVPGRTYPVEGSPKNGKPRQIPSYKLNETAQELAQQGKNILIFEPGKGEIAERVSKLQSMCPDAEVLPLFSGMEEDEQNKVFKSYGNKQKIVVATNVAETSITIPDIDVVLDTGISRNIRLRNGVEILETGNISKKEAIQRAGRAGRCKPGDYYLCNEDNYDDFEDEKPPEVQNSHLDKTVLMILEAGLVPEDLDFFHEVSTSQIAAAKEKLKALGAVDKDNKITKLGTKMAHMPTSTDVSRMILESVKHGGLNDVLTIAAVESTNLSTLKANNQGTTSQLFKAIKTQKPEELNSYLIDLEVPNDIKNRIRKLNKKYQEALSQAPLPFSSFIEELWLYELARSISGISGNYQQKKTIYDALGIHSGSFNKASDARAALNKAVKNNKNINPNDTPAGTYHQLLTVLIRGNIHRLYIGDSNSNFTSMIDKTSSRKISHQSGYINESESRPIVLGLPHSFMSRRGQQINVLQNISEMPPNLLRDVVPEMISNYEEKLIYENGEFYKHCHMESPLFEGTISFRDLDLSGIKNEAFTKALIRYFLKHPSEKVSVSIKQLQTEFKGLQERLKIINQYDPDTITNIIYNRIRKDTKSYQELSELVEAKELPKIQKIVPDLEKIRWNFPDILTLGNQKIPIKYTYYPAEKFSADRDVAVSANYDAKVSINLSEYKTLEDIERVLSQDQNDWPKVGEIEKNKRPIQFKLIYGFWDHEKLIISGPGDSESIQDAYKILEETSLKKLEQKKEMTPEEYKKARNGVKYWNNNIRFPALKSYHYIDPRSSFIQWVKTSEEQKQMEQEADKRMFNVFKENNTSQPINLASQHQLPTLPQDTIYNPYLDNTAYPYFTYNEESGDFCIEWTNNSGENNDEEFINLQEIWDRLQKEHINKQTKEKKFISKLKKECESKKLKKVTVNRQETLIYLNPDDLESDYVVWNNENLSFDVRCGIEDDKNTWVIDQDGKLVSPEIIDTDYGEQEKIWKNIPENHAIVTWIMDKHGDRQSRSKFYIQKPKNDLNKNQISTFQKIEQELILPYGMLGENTTKNERIEHQMALIKQALKQSQTIYNIKNFLDIDYFRLASEYGFHLNCETNSQQDNLQESLEYNIDLGGRYNGALIESIYLSGGTLEIIISYETIVLRFKENEKSKSNIKSKVIGEALGSNLASMTLGDTLEMQQKNHKTRETIKFDNTSPETFTQTIKFNRAVSTNPFPVSQESWVLPVTQSLQNGGQMFPYFKINANKVEINWSNDKNDADQHNESALTQKQKIQATLREKALIKEKEESKKKEKEYLRSILTEILENASSLLDKNLDFIDEDSFLNHVDSIEEYIKSIDIENLSEKGLDPSEISTKIKNTTKDIERLKQQIKAIEKINKEQKKVRAMKAELRNLIKQKNKFLSMLKEYKLNRERIEDDNKKRQKKKTLNAWLDAQYKKF